jgi:hypothetical protein
MTTDQIIDTRPLMLWCSSHTTLAAEEIPMFLEAGFRVVPLLTDFWTFEYAPSLDSKICQDWKATVDLPQEIVRQLQAIKFCENTGQNELAEADLQLLNDHVDVVYISVLPNLAIRLAKAFKGTVVFRPFGHGHLNNYSAIARGLNADVAALAECPNYIWSPILTTLQWPEDPRICVNANHLGAFVTPARLGEDRWSPVRSEPYVVETIPRIEKQAYYMEIYKKYRNDHGQLPLKILGGNSARGAELNDPAILGFLDDATYYRTAANARVSIYHGRSPFHVHYHPIEFMALGVPVLFHSSSAFAAEGRHFGLNDAQLIDAGMYHSSGEANEMALAAFDDSAIAAQWSRNQKFFLEEVFNRKKALDQARWIKGRVLQLRNWPEKIAHKKVVKKSLPSRIAKEVKRALRKAKLLSQPQKAA